MDIRQILEILLLTPLWHRHFATVSIVDISTFYVFPHHVRRHLEPCTMLDFPTHIYFDMDRILQETSHPWRLGRMKGDNLTFFQYPNKLNYPTLIYFFFLPQKFDVGGCNEEKKLFWQPDKKKQIFYQMLEIKQI